MQQESRGFILNYEAGSKISNLTSLFLLGLIIIFVLIVRMQFLHIPFERDEGAYCYMGQLVLEGKVPYLDFQEMKPPALYYCYAALMFFFGKTIEGAHLGFMFLNILTIIILYFSGMKLLSSRSAGLATAASYAILSLTPALDGFTVQSEHLLSFFLSAGLLLLLSGFETKRLFYFCFSGILFCLAFLVKQNGIFFLAFAGIIIPVNSSLQTPVQRKELIKRITAYSAGAIFVLIVTATVLYFQGALKACLFWTITYSSGYVSNFSLSHGLNACKHTGIAAVNKNIWIWLLAAFGLILSAFSSKLLPLFTRIFIGLFALLSFLAITPGMRFAGHYSIFLMPAVSLSVAAGVVCIRRILLSYFSSRIAHITALCLFGAAVLYNVYQQRGYYFNHDDKHVLRMAYGMCPFPEAKVIAEYIKRNSTEKDSIVVFGSECEIYFYSGRKCTSVHCDDELLQIKSEKTPVLIQEYERDLQNSPPRYFIADGSHMNRMQHADTGSLFNWINWFVITKYNVIGKIDMLTPDSTKYVWGEAAQQYKMESEFSMYVLERKGQMNQVSTAATQCEK